MVDLYSQIYANDSIEGDAATLAVQLREAYVAPDASARLAAMRTIWGGERAGDYGRYVLTAFAAARFAAVRSLKHVTVVGACHDRFAAKLA